jgi:hypothetical protein
VLNKGNLEPDIVAVHKGFLPLLTDDEREEGQINGTNLTWAQPLQVLEVKPSDGTLID